MPQEIPPHAGATIKTLLAVAILAAMSLPPTLAVDELGIFELDGDATDAAAIGEDWSTLYGGGPTSAHVFEFTSEPAPADSTYFTSGGSKDTNDINQWRSTTTDIAPDKDEITDAYGALYKTPSASVVYFGADRYAQDGTSDMGFWFLQYPVTLKPDGTFDGFHVTNDTLIVAEYTRGGQVVGLTAYRWTGTTIAKIGAGGIECKNNDAPDDLCARANTGPVPAPWPYTPKFGPSGTFPTAAFFEGGFNLSALAPGVKCFSKFIAETRSSTAPNAQLKDYVLGDFATCSARLLIEPLAKDNPTGTLHQLNVTLLKDEGNGEGPVAGARVDFTILSGPGSFAGDAFCVTNGLGQCSTNITSSAPGTTTVRASATVSLGGVSRTVQTNSPGGSGDATKRWVAARIGISPLVATNPVNTDHTFTALVEKNDSTWTAVPGVLVTMSIVSGPGSFKDGLDSCTTDATGTCGVTITSSAAGTTIVNASADVPVAGFSIHVATGSGLSSSNASKTWVLLEAAVSTTPSAPSIVLGGSVTDTATVTGTQGPGTGTIQFGVCAKDVVPCDIAQATAHGDPVPLDAEGTATSDPLQPHEAGTYCFAASYSGGGAYEPAEDSNDPQECVEVARAPSTTTTRPSDETILLGGTVHDAAHVTVGTPAGFPAPTGTVAFYVCAPGVEPCATGGTPLGDPVPLDEAGSATSADLTPLAAGRYCFRAEYSGDANYDASIDSTIANECVTVGPADATLTTVALPARTVLAGASVVDVATATGLGGDFPAPTGSVTFYLCQPADVTGGGCEGAAGDAVGAPKQLAGGAATSDATTDTLASGTYCWRVEYAGDANYAAASHTNADTECFTTIVPTPASCLAQAVTVRIVTMHLPAFDYDEILTQADATAMPLSVAGHGDAQQAGAAIAFPSLTPGGLSTGALRATCDASASEGHTTATGIAETDGLHLDITLPGTTLDGTPGVQVALDEHTLREEGASHDGVPLNDANIVDVGGVIESIPYGAFVGPAPPNHVIPLLVVGGVTLDLGYIVLNEQASTTQGDCTTNIGNAMRVVLYDLLAPPGSPFVEVNVSHVETTTCALQEGAPAPGSLTASCEATGLIVDVSPALLAPTGLTSTHSHASAQTLEPTGEASGDAVQHDVDVTNGDLPRLVHADALNATCAADGAPPSAAGMARVTNATIDLDALAIPIYVSADVIDVAAATPPGTIQTTFVNAYIAIGTTHYAIPADPAPNTVITLGLGSAALGELFLNEQSGPTGPCHETQVTGLRLVVHDPLSGPPTEAANVTLAKVTVTACGDGAAPTVAPPSPAPAASWFALAVPVAGPRRRRVAPT